MDLSLNMLANQVINDVYAGIKQPNNISLSLQQVKDEICQLRSRIVTEMATSGVIDLEPFMQTIFKLPVSKQDFSGVDGYESGRREYHAVLPEALHAQGIKPVAWVSTMKRDRRFKVIYGNDFYSYKYDRYSKNDPTVWVVDNSLWLFNPPVANIQHISIRYLLDDPRSINRIPGMKFMDDDPFPAPAAILDQIKSKLVNDFIRHYRMGHLHPTLMAGDFNVAPQEGADN